MGVGEWFGSFCSGLRIDQTKRASIGERTARLTGQLNHDFRALDSSVANRFYVGSFGRATAIPSVSDVDLLFELPLALYAKYDAYASNGQSALLAAVRDSLKRTYSTSEIAGDGQVVVVRFTDGIKFEVLPAFFNVDGGYTFADTNSGGTWRACKPKQEMEAFANRNSSCNGNLVELARMARAWRDQNNVPMSGMLIDTLAFQFIVNWPHREKSYLYYDWMTRDFFSFLAAQDSAKTHWTAPGSGSHVYRQGAFEFKARQAELRALEAIAHVAAGQEWSARQSFRDVYGSAFPT
jgi:hypothetical protein